MNNDPFGSTRSSIQANHALITPDTHVESPLIGWKGTTGIIHISPQLGARFTQYTARLEAGGTSGAPLSGVERFIFVSEGNVEITGKETATLSEGGFAYFPAETKHTISAKSAATLVVFEKPFQSLSGANPPQVVVGQEHDVASEPFLGDPDAQLKTLLPIEPAFDMAVNVFTYQPGATLPQVEIHEMEHGLLMIDGAGVYRLGDCWYPVQEGDVIWMASYCPQWFVAMGKTPARYIYYKDIHRDPLEYSL